MCRALENTVYVAASNVAGPDQGSATGIIAPDGTLVASLDYGGVGVVAADIDLDLATRGSPCAGRRSGAWWRRWSKGSWKMLSETVRSRPIGR